MLSQADFPFGRGVPFKATNNKPFLSHGHWRDKLEANQLWWRALPKHMFARVP